MSPASSRTDLDSPWKDVLDRYFPAFLELLFPDIHAAIDWQVRTQHLDSELRRLLRAARTGGRRVDKLVRVTHRDGQPLLVLVHVEIQSQVDPDFPKRMFTYHYKILDRYAEPVVSLAVLADARSSWRPRNYAHALWGCQLRFSFPVAKLTDWLQRQPDLEQSRNPFATVVLAHLRHNATRTDPHARMAGKLHLSRALYRKGFTAQQVRDLFAFIDWVLTLPKELDEKFDWILINLEKEKHMPYITGFERRAIARGHQEGRQRALASTLQRLLARRFGPLPESVLSRLQDATIPELERLFDKVLDAPSLQALFPDAYGCARGVGHGVGLRP
jgi:hypothetical protein